MIFLLLGENSLAAQQKINSFKSAFLSKGGDNSLITEVSGEDASFDELATTLSGPSLFNKKQLIVLKHIFCGDPNVFGLLNACGEALSKSTDIVVFWEKKIEDKKINAFFEKYADKTQQLDGEKNKNTILWIRQEIKEREFSPATHLESEALGVYEKGGAVAVVNLLDRRMFQSKGPADKTVAREGGFSNEVFRVVDVLFQRPAAESFVALTDAIGAGRVYPEEVLRIVMWQLKTMMLVLRGDTKTLKPFVVQKTKKLLAGYSVRGLETLWWEGILTDSAMKRDKKNTIEHLERLVLSIKQSQKTMEVRLP